MIKSGHSYDTEQKEIFIFQKFLLDRMGNLKVTDIGTLNRLISLGLMA